METSDKRDPSVSFEQFVEATFTAVLRAVDAREARDPASARLPGTVTLGIVWHPDAGEVERVSGRPT